ncbi:hypothetical protein [Flavobacterium degerlachei]|jgi:hypothetical protein|uniref:Nicotinate-nucleotide adenylyltransferase n=1 Tax=Flavobacterium degerlachei TaxID=229203 RepID=A0A1H2X0G6_9FLAO|nr:hypothetical protein [Flavobacterium degerlachei]SDW86393.1 hypothetical protein SAMN05444338_105111 [Flavobacterium degerlachei]
MKSFIIALLLLGLTTTSYSQDKTKKDVEEGIIKMEELPAVVIKRVGTDFSIYLPDNNPDQDVRRLEEKFIAYDIGKDYEGSENYLLLMQTKDGSLSATYNENGKLIRVVENYKNVRLPNEVIYSIYRTYPDWTIVNDKYLYTQEEGDILKKQYNLKIKKDKQTLRLTVRPNGDILKVR